MSKPIITIDGNPIVIRCNSFDVILDTKGNEEYTCTGKYTFEETAVFIHESKSGNKLATIDLTGGNIKFKSESKDYLLGFKIITK